MNEKIGKIKLELLKEEFIKQIKDSYTLNLSMVLLEEFENLQQENKQSKYKLSKIETLIINHNCDTGDIYYKYNSKFLKSELKQRILEIVYEEGSGE